MINRNYVTPQILADIDKINSDCIRMHLPAPPVTFVQCDVSRIDGDVPMLSHFEKANSWLRNYYNLLLATATMTFVASDTTYGAGHINVKYTNGSVISCSSGNNSLGNPSTAIGGATDTTHGIILGTNNGAESFESHTLGAKIAHGTSAGQLSYGAGSMSCSYNSGTKKWTVLQTRIMTNTSGGEIVIAETGMIWNTLPGGASYPSLIERNLLAATVAVPNNYKITVTYTFEMTFPA